MRSRLGQKVKALWPVVLCFGLVSCGDEEKSGDDDDDDDSGDECTADCTGKGTVTKAVAGKVTVTFPDAEVGAQYVLMPYVLGDLAIEGSDGNTKFTFAVSKAKKAATAPKEGAGLIDLSPQFAAAQKPMTASERDHNLRTLLNRYDPSKGTDQGAEFWAIAKAVDASGAGLKLHGGPSIEGFYRNTPKAVAKAKHSLPLTAGECPVANVVSPDPDMEAGDALKFAPLDFATPAVDGTDFCLVYVDEPKTEADKTKIQATVKAVVDGYKKTIYKDDFTGATGYTFKPVIAIIDFANPNRWPTDVAALKVAGVFLGAASSEAKVPMLYMAADFATVGGPADAALANKLWHSTIAHEMQHAISNWYHVRKTAGVEETVAVDEGIAHFFEDVWGYGAENFEGYPKKFLDVFSFGTSSFLNAANGGAAESRGSSQMLMFYLASQKGGVTFGADGRASGGAGLDLITSIVKNSASAGPKGIASSLGADLGAWTEKVGDFLGAVVLDGGTVPGISAKYKTQGRTAGVTDLNGTAGKKYGMTFNGAYGAAAEQTIDHVKEITENAKLDGVTSVEVEHYMTKPLLYTVTDPDENVIFALPADVPGAAVSAVRVK